jgi:hypothetical protein
MFRLAGLTVFLCTTLAPAGRAQLLSLGLRGGLATATAALSTNGAGVTPGMRTSFAVGPTGTLWLGDGFAIQFDALFAGKGFATDAADGVTSALDLSYLDVPLVAVFTVPGARSGLLQARLQAGTSFGFRIQCSLDRGTGDVTGITDCNPDNVGTFDLGLIGGAGIKIGRGRGGIVLDATYTWGLLDVNRNAGITARNRAIMITAGVVFPII